jgi:Phage tail lysozyme
MFKLFKRTDNQPEIDPNTLKGKDRPLYIKKVLMDLGWKDYQAAAMTGQSMQESYTDCRTDVWGDKHTAYGICQWRDNYDKATGKFSPGRLTDLANFAVSTNQPMSSIKTQAEFINWELTKGSQKNVGTALKKTKNIDEALLVAIGFERPRGYTKEHPENGDGFANRSKYAKSLM